MQWADPAIIYKHDQRSVVYNHVVELYCEEGQEGQSGDHVLAVKYSPILTHFPLISALCVSDAPDPPMHAQPHRPDTI